MKTKFKTDKKIKWIAWLAIISLSVFMGLATLCLKNLRTLYSVMQFLPTHHPALLMDTAVRQKFKLEDHPTYIGLLELPPAEPDWLSQPRMQQLTKVGSDIEKMTGVTQVISLANVQGATDLRQTLVVGKISELTPVAHWRERFLGDPLLSPTLLSRDAHTVMIYVLLESADVGLLQSFEVQFRRILTDSFPKAKATVGGVPAIQTDLGILLNHELRNFILLTLLACALTLFLIFRNLTSMWVPLILTAFANVMVFAMMAITGLAFTVLSSTIPILVFIAVVSIVVHVMLRVSEDAHRLQDHDRVITKWDLILDANKAVWLPNLLGALTTCVGFLTLLTSDVPMIREYGVGVAAAVMISWAVTSLGLLPLLVLLPLPVPRLWVQRPARWSLWILSHRRWLVVSVTVLTLIALFFGRNLNWTARLFDDLPENQEARLSSETVDRSMGGIVPMEMSIELPPSSDWNDPERIASLDHLLRDLRQIPVVGTAQSLPDFLKASGVSGAKLPRTRQQIAEIYFLYSFSNNNPLTSYMTNDSRSVRVELKLHDWPADQAQISQTQIRSLTEKAFPDSQIQVAGMGAVIHIIHHEISTDLIFGFWQALVIIVVLLSLVFRSVRWSLVAALPNLIPPILLLGYLVLTHTPIKPSVAIIFSIALGLAFNNTVYVLNRLRSLTTPSGRLSVQKNILSGKQSLPRFHDGGDDWFFCFFIFLFFSESGIWGLHDGGHHCRSFG